jgi:hypothetical protein
MTDTHRAALVKTRQDTLAGALQGWFDGSHPHPGCDQAYALLSLDELGRPHTSLLSLGELWAPDPQHLRLALWPSARAVAHLEQRPRAALTGVADGVFFQIQLCEVRTLGLAAGLQCFSARVEQVETQRVAYAQLKNGIVFTLEDDAVLVRWRAQLTALQAWT